jgi:hypothetical protein
MKKGQAAMEFLMTYGWAILVVIAAIAALAYFGVLSPANFLPERCTGEPGMDCIDKAVFNEADNTTQFAFKNNLGYEITVTNVEVKTDGEYSQGAIQTVELSDSDGVFALVATRPVIKNGQQAIVKITGNESDGERAEADFVLSYTSSQSGLDLKANYVIRGKYS